MSAALCSPFCNSCQRNNHSCIFSPPNPLNSKKLVSSQVSVSKVSACNGYIALRNIIWPGMNVLRFSWMCSIPCCKLW